MKKTEQNLFLTLTIAAVAVGSVVGLSGCGTTTAAENPTAKGMVAAESALRDVRVSNAVTGEVKELIVRTATLAAPNSVSVLPKISGQIVELAVEEGTPVRAGQLIARLDAPQLQLAAEKARAVRAKAQHDLDLASRQFKAQIINHEEELSYRHRAEQAERDYQQAVIELDKTRVLSPIDGVISRRLVSAGDMVFSGSVIVTIMDPSRLEADVLVPQDQVERVAVGNDVMLFPNGDEARTISGRVERVSPVIETESGTVKVTVRVTAGQRNVMPGQFVKVHLITGTRKNAVLVPREAIVVENAMNVLYKVVDGFARRIPVALGTSSDGKVQVIGDITEGDPVVVVGIAGLDDMTRVRILEDAVAE